MFNYDSIYYISLSQRKIISYMLYIKNILLYILFLNHYKINKNIKYLLKYLLKVF